MDYEAIKEKVGQILLNHGMKEVIIKGRKNYIYKGSAQGYLRLDHWNKNIQIESADNYEQALLGVYEDDDGFAVPVSLFPPDEAEKLSDEYISKFNYSEYDFYSIIQLYIVLFYKEEDSLNDRTEELGFKRSLVGLFETSKDDIKCSIDYDIKISRTVCRITSESESMTREYDYDQAFCLCEDVISELEKFMKNKPVSEVKI